MLLTTTIGAYPKPDTVINGEDKENVLNEAVREVVREQVNAGIYIPTDGEIRRENYIHYHCRHLTGINFNWMNEKMSRAGTWAATLPTIVGNISPKQSFLIRDWTIAQEATEQPVKITVPGPLTIADTLVDKHYGDPKTLNRVLAEALNFEIRSLARAGCLHIQIDEPVFARYPDAALDFGIENLERCFYGVPKAVTRSVHICCGYPKYLDQINFPKAPAENYFKFAADLEIADIDAVSIEDAHRHNDLTLLEHFKNTSVILGVVNVANSRIETVDEIKERLVEAMDHIDPRRLIVAPDCGLIMLPREIARQKLINLGTAARELP